MERFWRSLRAGCLDHLGSLSSLHDVQVRLDAFVADHYHRAPHGGLLVRLDHIRDSPDGGARLGIARRHRGQVPRLRSRTC